MKKVRTVQNKSNMNFAGTSTRMFGPLVFEEFVCGKLEDHTETKCLLCEDTFNLQLSLPVFLVHIFDVHNVIIEGVENIKKLHEYILYWRDKFKRSPLEQIIPSINLKQKDQRYFLMSNLLKEDKALRHKLNLEYALKVQEFERNDTSYVKPCLFCKLLFEGSRQKYLEHLSNEHNLQLGNSQNLVYIEELVNKIETTITNLQCIFCEKTFPERNILKEHMRKKLHKRINPQNTEYDRFYIVNYLEEDKNWHKLQNEADTYALSRDAESNADEEYSDWNEKEDQITCLFCEKTETHINTLCLHMDGDHDFDFVMQTEHLDFYQKIKLINYIRKQVHDRKCIFCDTSFESSSQLKNHQMEENHYKIPELKVFDQPEFYFSTYENDALLYLINNDIED